MHVNQPVSGTANNDQRNNTGISNTPEKAYYSVQTLVVFTAASASVFVL